MMLLEAVHTLHHTLILIHELLQEALPHLMSMKLDLIMVSAPIQAVHVKSYTYVYVPSGAPYV